MFAEKSGSQTIKGLGLNILSRATLDTVHHAACRLLRTTGVIVEHKGAADRLSAAGCRLETHGEFWKAYFPEWLINDCLDSCPKSLVLGARNPENDFYLEYGRTGFSTFGEQVKVIDPYTREYRSSVRKDARMIYKVVDSLPGLVTGSRTVCPNDLPEALQQAHNFYDALTCTSKHIWMGLSNQETLELARRMVIAVQGKEAAMKKPINTVTACPTSPLTLVEMACVNIIGAAESEVMNVEIMEMCLAGGTSPATLAGTIVQTLAEHLSGIVLAQVSRKGTHTLMGSCSSNLDLKNGLSPMSSPENTLIASSMATIAGYYGLPIRTGGGVTDSKIPDAQAGYEYAANALALALAGANVIWGVGGLDSGLGFDFAKLLMDHEFGNNVRFMLQGIDCGYEEMALELIEEVGPGGSYLTHKHTFKRARNQSKAALFSRAAHATWEKAGSKTMTETAYEKAIQIIESYEPKALPAEAQAEIDGLLAEFVKKHG